MPVDCTFVTYSKLPDLDPSDRLLFEALTRRGVNCAIALWNDPDYRWDQSRHTVLRSTWDYHLHLTEFMSWLGRISTSTRVWNPLELVRWNVQKTYLLELQKSGVPVVPTRLVPHGAKVDLSDVLKKSGWNDAIIKPVVGLATYGVQRVSAAEAEKGQQALAALLEDDDALVQKFIPSVNDYGERSLVYIGGQFSHAVRKTAFQPLRNTGEAGETPATATDKERAVAESALSCLPVPPLYARVDLVPDGEDNPVIMELELVEPSLFVSFSPQAPELFADAFCKLS